MADKPRHCHPLIFDTVFATGLRLDVMYRCTRGKSQLQIALANAFSDTLNLQATTIKFD